MTVSFSVFIPVWNDARWLPGAIESVLSQTHPAWELVIGDNASTDDLAAIVDRYRDPRLRYHRWPTHTGIYENQNRTATLCRFEWTQLLCADDRLHPSCLERLAERIERVGEGDVRVVAAIAACRRVDELGRPAQAQYSYQSVVQVPDGLHDGRSWLHYAAQPGIAPWNFGAVALSREALAEMGGMFRPDVGLGSDVEVVMRASAYGRVAYLDEQLLDCTVRGNSDRSVQARRNRERNDPCTPMGAAFLSALRVHEMRRTVGRDERAAIARAIARSHLQRAVLHRYPGGGGRRAAFVDILRAVRYSPLGMLDPSHLAYAGAALFAPRALIDRVRASVAARRYEGAAAPVLASTARASADR